MSRRFHPFADFNEERSSGYLANAQQTYYKLKVDRLMEKMEAERRKREETEVREIEALKQKNAYLENELKQAKLSKEKKEEEAKDASIAQGRVDIRRSDQRNDSETILNYAKSLVTD